MFQLATGFLIKKLRKKNRQKMGKRQPSLVLMEDFFPSSPLARPRSSVLIQNDDDKKITSSSGVIAKKKIGNKRRTGCQEFRAIVGVIVTCISLIVKGVAFANSHWANSERVDVYRALEKFPLMVQHLDITPSSSDNNAIGGSECEETKCKIFFSVYHNQRSINVLQRKTPPPLSGTYNRGVNIRCETLETSLTGSAIASKFEKCSVDKERDINDFKTVRILLIISMVADGLALFAWGGTFLSSGIARLMPGHHRALFGIAALLGFISSLLATLGLGLFAQAVDIINDTSLTLGWPFYVVLTAAVLTFLTAILAAWGLCQNYRRHRSVRLDENNNNAENGLEMRHRYKIAAISLHDSDEKKRNKEGKQSQLFDVRRMNAYDPPSNRSSPFQAM